MGDLSCIYFFGYFCAATLICYAYDFATLDWSSSNMLAFRRMQAGMKKSLFSTNISLYLGNRAK